MTKKGIAGRWSFKRDMLTLYYAFKDTRTPWYAKFTSLLSVVYLLSPIDFVPDVIPFAGYVDDLFIVPFLLSMANKLLPAQVRMIAEQKAKAKNKKLTLVMILIGVVIVGILVLLFLLTRKAFFASWQ
jgi:uncharacterized membrane protein YkvA (DUF1232 family)